MISERSANVFSNVMRGWEPCLSACENYCMLKGLQYPSECPVASVVVEAKRSITLEYDGFADMLGRPFACGDKSLDQDLDTIFAGNLRELYDLIIAQISPNAAGNGNGTRPFSTKPSPPRVSGDTQQWQPKGEALARAALESTLQALRTLASRQGYVRDEKPPSHQPPVNDPEVAYCKGALLLQSPKADIFTVVQQQSSAQHYRCNFCYLDISNFESSAASCTPNEWADIVSCHVLACPSFKDRRAAFCCHACFAEGDSFIVPSAAAMREHLRQCIPMRNFKNPAPPVVAPRPSQRSQLESPTSPPNSQRPSQRPSQTPSANISRNQSPRGAPPLQPSPYLGPEDARTPRYDARQPASQDMLRPQTPQGPNNNRPRTANDRNASPSTGPGGWYSPPSSATINRAAATPDVAGVEEVRSVLRISQSEAAELLRQTGGNVAEAIELQLDQREEDGEGERPSLPTRERHRNPY